MPNVLVGADTHHERSRAQLPLRRPRKVHRQGNKKNDDDDEQCSPSPIWLFRRLLVRTYRQTH